MMQRFEGTCAPIGPVDIDRVVEWISAIPLVAWPQQLPADDGSLRPAMVNDLAWYGFGEASDHIVNQLLLPGCRAANRMLSVLMPGARIEAHRDRQLDDWLARVHVPLLTDKDAVCTVGGAPFHMRPGMAYLFNTLEEHSSVNAGTQPRIHFMFDVHAR
jgi:hypothetical protein